MSPKTRHHQERYICCHLYSNSKFFEKHAQKKERKEEKKERKKKGGKRKSLERGKKKEEKRGQITQLLDDCLSSVLDWFDDENRLQSKVCATL